MSENIQPNIEVYKKHEFNAYILWRSLPSFLKGQPRYTLEKLGITDDITLDLLQIKTQTAFAKTYNIKDLGTLTDWNKKINREGLVLNEVYRWARTMTPNVVFALYKNASKNGRAQEVRAWFELIEHNH
jgi:hypothetical protein